MANIALVVAGILFLVAGSLYISYDSQLAERKTRVQDAVEIVVSYANALSHDTAADPASQAKALEGLLRNLAKVRYDGQTYFNVISADGVFLLQSGNPKLTGTSAFDLTDTHGRHYVRDLFAKVKQHGRGFYNAESPRAGETKLVAKVNYGQAIPAFNAVVTSGLYVDDLRAALLWQALLLACIGVPTLLLTGGFSLVIRSSVGGAMVRLAGTMDRLAQGDLGVAIVGTARRDEYGAMARAVQVFKENMIRAEQLAEEVRKASEGALSREAADAAREKFRAEAHTVVSGLAMGLAALADGNLVCSLDTPFAPQYEQLRTDYNAAVTQLRGIIEQIVQNTHAIGDEIGDITKASDDLSHRTEQQAASLEQTVAAVDHLTGTVKKTAEGAQNAQDIAQTARAEAEQSGTVVSDAITAMSEIENSSRQISQIIGVIDEIAFQTSLLALNAGVEAARAGDAGRGFAVVASEVRALAQRAANAAKEIKDLIAASSTHVARGVGLVGETGKALHRIVAQVGQVHTAIAAIAASAKEQATGLQEINTAMNQMDQVTQRNAAMVGESTAASHNLAAETEELARLTGQFKLLAA